MSFQCTTSLTAMQPIKQLVGRSASIAFTLEGIKRGFSKKWIGGVCRVFFCNASFAKISATALEI